jgi:hypothetical protein
VLTGLPASPIFRQLTSWPSGSSPNSIGARHKQSQTKAELGAETWTDAPLEICNGDQAQVQSDAFDAINSAVENMYAAGTRWVRYVYGSVTFA